MPPIHKKILSLIFLLIISAGMLLFYYLFIERNEPNPVTILSEQLKEETYTLTDKEQLISDFINDVETGVNATAGVSPNVYNQLALQLKNKELNLNDKERLIQAQEAELNKNNRGFFAIILMFIAILFVLITLNFYFDYRRYRISYKK